MKFSNKKKFHKCAKNGEIGILISPKVISEMCSKLAVKWCKTSVKHVFGNWFFLYNIQVAWKKMSKELIFLNYSSGL